MQIGPFHVVRELARGGMGAVYLAQAPTGEQVAIKLILDAGLADPEAHRRFAREAMALETLNHPGILRVRSHGIDRGRPYMVMDLLSGPTLLEAVRAEGAFAPRRVAELGRRMAAALAHAHGQGILHRDLKPANVILRGDDPVLVDFGLVRMLHHDVSRLTNTGVVMGSPAYMSPEQADGSREVGPAVDIYGLGATLYCLATGRPPFEGQSSIALLKQVLSNAPLPPSEVCPGVDPELERVILRCLEKHPAARFPSAAALERACAQAFAGRARSQRGSAQAPQRSPLKIAAFGLLSAVPALLVGGWLVWGGDERAEVHGARTPGPPTPTAPAETGASAEAVELVERGRALANQGRLDDALRLFGDAIRLEPEYALAWIKRGQARSVLGDNGAALVDLERAQELDPHAAEAFGLAGAILAQEGRFTDALRVLEQALRLNPDDPQAYRSQAAARFGAGQVEGSVESLDAYLRLLPDDAERLSDRGTLKSKLGRPLEALEDFSRALELSPNHSEIWDNRGSTLLLLGRFAEAAADHRRALKLDPRSTKAWLNLAAACIGVGQFAEAVQACDRALALDPQAWGVYVKRGTARAKLGQLEAALSDLDRARERYPDNVDIGTARLGILQELERNEEALTEIERLLDMELTVELRSRLETLRALSVTFEEEVSGEELQQLQETLIRGMTHLRERETAEALAHFDRVLASRPTFYPVHAYRGVALLDLERYAEAIEAYDEAQRHGATSVRIFTNRAYAKARLGRLEAALEDFDHALKVDPDEKNALAQRAEILAALRRSDEAARGYERLARLKPNNAGVWLSLGMAYSASGKFPRAEQAISRSLELNTSDPVALYQRGFLRLRLGRAREALVDCERALAASPSDQELLRRLHELREEASAELGE